MAACLAAGASAETPQEQLMNATLKIYNAKSTATGWLLRDERPDASPTNVVLVTAAHVLDSASGDNVLLVCRMKNDDGTWRRHDHPVTIRQNETNLWTSHGERDIAAIRCVLPPDALLKPLPQSALCGDERGEQEGVTIATPIFYTGYPCQIEANSAAFPIFRAGCISGYPLYPSRDNPHIFFSAPTFDGDSGAAVAVTGKDGAPLIIGLVISRTRRDDKLKADGWKLTFNRDLNLGSFVQTAFILETLELLKEQEAQAAAAP